MEDKKAHYIAVIKGNPPLLHQQMKQLPSRDVPLLGKTRATAHGRGEIRRVKTATSPAASPSPTPPGQRRTVTIGKVTWNASTRSPT